MYRRYFSVRFVLSVLLCLLTHHSIAQTAPQLLFSIHGSNTLGAELTAQLLQGWLHERGARSVQRVAESRANEYRIRGFDRSTQTWQEVLVTAHGSSTGFKHLAQQSGEIAASSRPIQKSEALALKSIADMTSASVEQVVAIDGLAIIVHPDNPVETLSVEQLQAIFSGEITDWQQLGAKAGLIHLYARDEESGTWDSFKSMVLDKQSLAQAQRFDSNSALAEAVLSDRHGIGFVSMAAVGKNKLLAIYEGKAQALKPNHLSVATEDYVLSRRLFMYAPTNKPEVQDFIRYMQSDAGQQVVAQTGYISQKIEAVLPEAYQSLPVSYQKITANAQRLTVNFRFLDDKVELDNKGVKDIQRLVDYMQNFPTQQLLLVGFVDPKSTDVKSQRLSTLRTRLVNSKLMRLGVHNAEVIGLGDDLLVAATDEFGGRLRNRRVEVWVRP